MKKHTYPRVSDERGDHILCNLACKRDGQVPHHPTAKYSELESMVVELQGYLDAFKAELGDERCDEILVAHRAKREIKRKESHAMLHGLMDEAITLIEPRGPGALEDFAKRLAATIERGKDGAVAP